jgi:hypothetical protein
MTISEYNLLLSKYNAAWQTVCDMRSHVQQADAYLSAYGIEHQSSALFFRINPAAHVDPPSWASAETILTAVTKLKEIGEQVVSAFNHLSPQDRYLVKLPKLR